MTIKCYKEYEYHAMKLSPELFDPETDEGVEAIEALRVFIGDKFNILGKRLHIYKQSGSIQGREGDYIVIENGVSCVYTPEEFDAEFYITEENNEQPS